MGKLVLGLDIGVTSVGYGIVDLDNDDFVDYGVRLFKEGTAQNNADRREHRSSRRLKRRRTNRINDMKNLLTNIGVMKGDYKPGLNPYEMRVKGLSEKLDDNELVCAILHLTKRRGSSIETVEDEEGETKEVLNSNHKLLNNKRYVCEIQLDRLKEEGVIRGHINNFKTSDYVDELKTILANQDLQKKDKDMIIELITRKRAYYEGPGSFKSPTPYGRFIEEDGNIKEIDLIEKMRGKCSVFHDELRAPKHSYAAEYFNVLNDLNNLSIKGKKLDEGEKREILIFIDKNQGITPAKIAKILGVDLTDIDGFRVNKSNKALFTEMKGFKTVAKIFNQHNLIEMLENKQIIDDVIEVVTQTKGLDERMEKISQKCPNLSAELVDDLANIKGISGYHSLSYKALDLINEEMLKSELNQMQVLHQLQIFDKSRPSHKGKKNIVFDDTAILSPVAVRAQKEAIKLVNYLRKRYGEFDSIVVETTRDKNTQEQKKRIRDSQKYFEERNKEIDKLLEDRGMDPNRVNNKTKLKIKLYLEQDGKTIYCQHPIDLSRLIADPNLYEIEHILPISISLDDSLSNKALASRRENQLKGNMSPLEAFSKGKFSELGGDINVYKQSILNNGNYSRSSGRRKREYLLFEKDLNKYENAKEFIARNLVDTSYACRIVGNTLQNYFKDNDIPTNVHTVKGKFTHIFRKRINMNKEREADYLHHAIDALIVASIKKIALVSKYCLKYNINDLYDENTGELLPVGDEKEVINPNYIEFIANLKNIYEESRKYYFGLMKAEQMSYQPIKISHKIDTKPNRQLFDETIYSTRNVNGQDMLTETYKDIYDPKFDKLTNDIIQEKAKGKYIMAAKDPETFKVLEMIVRNHFDNYRDDQKFYKYDRKSGNFSLKGENPLSIYKEEFGKVRKYSKKNNGPEVTKIRYYSEKLGNHVDISDNYSVCNKKVIVKQIKPYRTDIYVSPEGKYNFVTIRYKDVKYFGNKGKFVIDPQWYNTEKKRKKIIGDWDFVCSLHRDEVVMLRKKEGQKYVYDGSVEGNMPIMYHDGSNYEFLKFTATNNDKTGTLEFKPIFTYCKKQLMVGVGTFTKVAKLSTDIGGKMYKVTDNVLKLEF